MLQTKLQVYRLFDSGEEFFHEVAISFFIKTSYMLSEQNRTETLLTLRSILTYEDKNKYIR